MAGLDSSRFEAANWEGALFGPYRVLRLLAQGGMGAVFEVEHAQTGVRYALKTIVSGRELTAGRERFQREAELSARFTHLHLLRVYSADFAGPHPYLVVDLLSGGSLAERLHRSGPLSLAEGLALASQLAGALAHAHERGVLHRDIKPENVMFRADGSACLVDFGIALDLDRETRLTRSGAMVGTPLLMAPEQVAGERSEAEPTDVYGLASTVYWAWAGEPPLGSEHAGITQLMATILTQVPVSLRQVRRDLPRAVAALIDASLRKDPEARPSLAVWVETLARAGEPESRRPRALVLASVAALALGGVGLALAYGSQRAALPEGDSGAAASASARVAWQETIQQVLSGPRPLDEARSARLRGALYGAPSPVAADEALLVLEACAALPPSEAEFTALGARLSALPEETQAAVLAGAWVVADLDRGLVLHATRRYTLPRELADLEHSRRASEAADVRPLYESARGVGGPGEAPAVYQRLADEVLAWRAERYAALQPLERRLAEIVVNRLLLTLGSLGVYLQQTDMVHGGTITQALAQRLLSESPPVPGAGRVVLALLLLWQGDSTPESRACFVEALPHEAELSTTQGGVALLGMAAVRDAQRAEDAIRLGLPALVQSDRMREGAVQLQWLAPRLLPRYVERIYLAPAEQTKLSAAATGLIESSLRLRHPDVYPGLISWELSRGELYKVEALLVEAPRLGPPHMPEILRIFWSELALARGGQEAAAEVLSRHSPARGVFLEERGLRAHALALLGRAPEAEEELAALNRERAAGGRRLGAPWHLIRVEEVIAGRAWWPGAKR